MHWGGWQALGYAAWSSTASGLGHALLPHGGVKRQLGRSADLHFDGWCLRPAERRCSVPADGVEVDLDGGLCAAVGELEEAELRQARQFPVEGAVRHVCIRSFDVRVLAQLGTLQLSHHATTQLR